MPKQLTKNDFLPFVPLSKNLPETQLAPYIQDALLMDVKPLLGDLYAAVMAETLQLNGKAADGMAEVDLVKAVWVFCAYVRFLPFHGLDITSSGITKSKDTKGTFEQAAPAERSQIIASFRSKVSYWEGELGKAIKAHSGTASPVVRKNRIGLRVVRSR